MPVLKLNLQNNLVCVIVREMRSSYKFFVRKTEG